MPAGPVGGLTWKGVELPEALWRSGLTARRPETLPAHFAGDGQGPRPSHSRSRLTRDLRPPLAKLGEDRAARFYRQLGGMLAPLVATKHDGTMYYRVTDEGWASAMEFADRAHAKGSRSTPTMPSDGCFRTSSGRSASTPRRGRHLPRRKPLFGARHGALDGTDLLRRLYAPALFDRQAEHRPDAPKLLRAPVFEWRDGILRTRLVPRLIHSGYEMASRHPDAELAEALVRVQDLLSQPCRHLGL
jgi:hypothetical protein